MDSTMAARRSHAIGVVTPVVSPAELYEVIVAACSQNFSQIQASGQRLKQMLEMFGTFDALQDIAARPNTPLPIRQQAIIQFKNTVVNHWRSRKCVLILEHRYPYHSLIHVRSIDYSQMNTECVYDKDVYTSWMKKTKQSVFLYNSAYLILS